MNTQMNTTDAEIAGKIDGVTRGGVQAKKDSYNDTLWVTDGENYIHVESGSDYLDHCRAVVSEVDGERYSVGEIDEYIAKQVIPGIEWRNHNNTMRTLQTRLTDPQDGISATTARHRKEQG